MVPLIEKAISDPGVDAEKMQVMFEALKQERGEVSFKSYIKDFALMQSEFPSIRQTAKGHNGPYASFDDINDGTAYARGKYGFALSFLPETAEGMMVITATLSHREGHVQTSTMTLPFDTSQNKNAVQSLGSALTYGMRYGIKALLSISTHDGDDNDAGSLYESVTAEEATALQEEATKQGKDVEKVFGYYSKKFKRVITDWDQFPMGSFEIVLSQLKK